jgi:peptidoglycan hydrolase-like protein with peptidoglycan-binding domain
MSDLILDRVYKKGSRGKKVKLIQEWLSLHGFGVKIDGGFGPATDYAVKEFQKRQRLTVDGVVGKNTFERLIKPMKDALKKIPKGGGSLGKMVAAYAAQHLKQHPREIGGQNRGPWVRLYMKGNDGAVWPWCAGFVCFILKQACNTMGTSLPLGTSFSCDTLAANAKRKGIFLKGANITDKRQIRAGSFFLTRRTSTDWTHTGIVVGVQSDFFHTIEGNTNDEGSREGYEVCARTRGYKNKDFIVI